MEGQILKYLTRERAREGEGERDGDGHSCQLTVLIQFPRKFILQFRFAVQSSTATTGANQEMKATGDLQH